MDRNRLIGAGNRLPWHLPADLQHFKRTTMGKAIIMGRRTHESIGRSLPGRTNIVVSRNPAYAAPGCIVVSSLEAALAVASGDEVFVIGGATLYRQALPHAHRLYLTLIDAEFDGDTHFPELDFAQWQVIERTACEADDRNPYAYTFLTLERRTATAPSPSNDIR